MTSNTAFFEAVRLTLFNGKLTQKQVNGMSAILNRWEKSKYTDLRWLAYMLATVYHETAKTMQPIEEYGKGKGYKYGRKIKRSGVTYSQPDKLYYGRGFVQLTWYENYELMGRLLKLNLLQFPEMALEMEVSTNILFEGMLRGASSFGDFTGRCLEMYFNDTVNDSIGARKIINGTDKAGLISNYHSAFLEALNK